MQPDLAHRLVDTLPNNNGLYRTNPLIDPGVAWSDALKVYAENDPAFAWKFVAECVTLKMELPALVTSSAMRQAYDYLIHGRCSRDFKVATLLRVPNASGKQWLIRGLLIDCNFPLAETAKYMCMSLNSVSIYEELFFSVRERFDDIGYIVNHIVYPTTRQVTYENRYITREGAGELVLRAGYEKGGYAALYMYGTKSKDLPVTEEQHAANMRHKNFFEADFLTSIGGVNQDSPAMRRASGLMVAQAQNSATKPVTNFGDGDLVLPPTMGKSLLLSMKLASKDAVFNKAINDHSMVALDNAMKELNLAEPPRN